MSAALRRFRIMAAVVGIALFVLVVSLVVKYGFDRPAFAEAYSPLHGFLYVGYLVAVADLGRRAGWSVLLMGGVMLAGTVPFLSFVVERRMTEAVRSQLA